MNAEAPLRRILGRIFSVAIILAAVLLAWAVGVDLRNNPRTEDAQVRANVIGVAPQVGGAVKEIHVVRIVIDEPETVSFRMGGSASVIVHTGWGTREGEARLRELQRSSELPFNSPVDE